VRYRTPFVSGVLPVTVEIGYALPATEWGEIEFLPAGNRDYVEATFAERTRLAATTPKTSAGFGSFAYLPPAPSPLWQLDIPFPQFGEFEMIPLILNRFRMRIIPPYKSEPFGASRVVGGFAYLDNDSEWTIYGQSLPKWGLIYWCLRADRFCCSPQFFNRTLAVALEHDLILVDWASQAVVDLGNVVHWSNG
jgi:hypothetical protein